MSFITFNYNENLKYAIIYWVLEIYYRCLKFFKEDLFILGANNIINEYYFLMLLNISDLLAGFLVLYTNCSFRRRKKKLNENQNQNNNGEIEIFEGRRNTYHRTKYYIPRIILICCLDYLNRSAYFIFNELNKEEQSDMVYSKAEKDIIIHLDIIARYCFSKFILKTKMFKHQKVAIYIIISILFVILIADVILIIYFSPSGINALSYVYILIFVTRGILFPFEDTIIKIIFTDDYIIPEALQFRRGLGELVIIAIITPIIYSLSNIGEIFKASLFKIIFISSFYCIISFVKAYLLLYIIYYLSSQSVSFLIISESITNSVCQIINYFISDNIEKTFNFHTFSVFVEIFFIIITLFATLIYDEIIIINKWGIDKNIKDNIISRGNLEVNEIGLIKEEIDDAEDEEEKNKLSQTQVTVYE